MLGKAFRLKETCRIECLNFQGNGRGRSLESLEFFPDRIVVDSRHVEHCAGPYEEAQLVRLPVAVTEDSPVPVGTSINARTPAHSFRTD